MQQIGSCLSTNDFDDQTFLLDVAPFAGSQFLEILNTQICVPKFRDAQRVYPLKNR